MENKSRVHKAVHSITPPIVASMYRRLAKSLRVSNSNSREEAHRRSVGGDWDTIGHHQFQFLVQHGLQPHHRLLDVGCGSLRGGVHYIKYLDDGNYYGIDQAQWLLDAGRDIEVPRAGIAPDRKINLLCRDDFDVTEFGVRFDYAIAQSVYTHLPWNSILRSLINIQMVLKPNGKFFATFFEAESPEHRLKSFKHVAGGRVTYPDRDPYHYEFDVFEELARRVGLMVTYIGNWDHPRDQRMMVFIHPEV